MHLIGMWFGDVPPFTQRIKFDFDKRVNVFVGPNASGKSTLLTALARYFKALNGESEAKRPVNDAYMEKFTELDFDDVEEFDVNGIAAPWDWFGDRDAGNPAVIHLDSVRAGLPGMSMLNAEGGEHQSAEGILSGPFSGSQTFKALEALVKEAKENRSDISNIVQNIGIRKAIEMAVACSKMVCNEIISDTTTRQYIPEFDSQVVSDDPVGHIEQPQVLRGAAIGTNDLRNFSNYPVREKPSWDRYGDDLDSAPIYIGHLSSGTEGTLLWIQWLAFKILHRYDFATGWEKQPAILLIDEIENHLHPTWQRRVIPALLEHFPGLQIFATTHSPFVVAGLKKGQVHLLNRDADGVVTASTNAEDVEGWTADEILRVYMGVEHPTDEATAAAARELRRLRDEGVRADEGAEEERQAEILRLRKIVDRVELSGPRVAENERFLTSLDAILERHIQSQSLNQENG